MNDADCVALLKEALFEVAPKRKKDFDTITLETPIADLKLDSIATMEMVGFVEDRLETTFEEDQLARVQSLGDLGRMMRNRA
jgi:acyl carrier protein